MGGKHGEKVVPRHTVLRYQKTPGDRLHPAKVKKTTLLDTMAKHSVVHQTRPPRPPEKEKKYPLQLPTPLTLPKKKGRGERL